MARSFSHRSDDTRQRISRNCHLGSTGAKYRYTRRTTLYIGRFFLEGVEEAEKGAEDWACFCLRGLLPLAWMPQLPRAPTRRWWTLGDFNPTVGFLPLFNLHYKTKGAEYR